MLYKTFNQKVVQNNINSKNIGYCAQHLGLNSEYIKKNNIA